METALTARDLDGDALYQQRARKALPILVRQAHAKATISYADLAAELDMTNPRTLNYPLGSVGNAIRRLAAVWGEDIPIINCLVVNQESGVPGDGISDFVRNRAEFTKLSRRKKRAIIEAVLSHVFAYPRWEEVLNALGLEPLTTRYESELNAAAAYRGGGESDIHKAFKSYVARNPWIVGLPNRAGPGIQEYPLPSGDSIDVFFSHQSVRTAVEVKSRISERADVVRGLFQCVKYRAVLSASIAVECSNDSAETVLVLEGTFPADLRELRNTLAVRVVDNARST